jgi:hypothetical protein
VQCHGPKSEVSERAGRPRSAQENIAFHIGVENILRIP